MLNDSTKRFSNRVDDYVKYRPGYPDEVLQLLVKKYGLLPIHNIVDVGSGTGISTEIFLRNGNIVYGVEPNEAMRTSAEKNLAKYKNFHSVAGTSDATKLPSGIADFIIVAQAFHWFNPDTTKSEFKRILKKNGRVVIIFNDRLTTGSDFSVSYENLLNEFGTDYKDVKHKNVSQKRHRDFLGEFDEFNFPNSQIFNFESLLGRLKSSSYAPKEGEARYLEMVATLKEIFNRNEKNGHVLMEYNTQVFVSRPAVI